VEGVKGETIFFLDFLFQTCGMPVVGGENGVISPLWTGSSQAKKKEKGFPPLPFSRNMVSFALFLASLTFKYTWFLILVF